MRQASAHNDGMQAPEAGSGRSPVVRRVADTVLQWIVEGRVRPGDRLPAQRDLAATLNVSRPSLREALSILEVQGYLSIEVGRGVFIAPEGERRALWRYADHATPRDVYEARIAVETSAAALAARASTKACLDALAESVAAMGAAAGRADIAAMAQADAQFHDLIIAACGNPIIAAMYRAVRDMMVESQALPMSDRSKLSETVKEHAAILAAFRAGDSAAAGRTMQRHITRAAARFGVDLSAAAD